MVVRQAIIRQLEIIRREITELILEVPCIETARLLSRARSQIRHAEAILENDNDADVDD